MPHPHPTPPARPARPPLPPTPAAHDDPTALEPSHARTRVRVTIAADPGAHLAPADPGARLAPAADPQTPRTIAEDDRGAMRAHLAGRPAIHRDPHPGVALPAATSRATEPARPRPRTIATHRARLSTPEARRPNLADDERSHR
jgi:hypothetical protein